VSDVKLTVLLPVYNGKKFVGRAIESVLAQSFRDFEFLILDDGSHDGTPQILSHCARQDERIRVLSHENKGVGYTLDRGIREARGALIAEIGSDDVALPGRFHKQVGFLDNHADHVLVGSYLRVIDSMDRVMGLQKCPTSDEQLRKCMPLYNPMCSPSVMYRRDEALAAGSYTTRFRTGCYYDFILRLALRGKIANLAEALAAYRFPERATKLRVIKNELRDDLRVKRIACSEYGYRQTLASLGLNLAQRVISVLPTGVVYWLLTKEFVLSEDEDAKTANEYTA
jgi:glycosyltransferase involved in cell wall biosynthesis